jgi:hypothetical protein
MSGAPARDGAAAGIHRKDWTERVPGDWTERVPGDWTERVPGDWTERVPGDWTERVPGDWTERVPGDWTEREGGGTWRDCGAARLRASCRPTKHPAAAPNTLWPM